MHASANSVGTLGPTFKHKLGVGSYIVDPSSASHTHIGIIPADRRRKSSSGWLLLSALCTPLLLSDGYCERIMEWPTGVCKWGSCLHCCAHSACSSMASSAPVNTRGLWR
jgi:hypothetical protein